MMIFQTKKLKESIFSVSEEYTCEEPFKQMEISFCLTDTVKRVSLFLSWK